MWMNRSGEVFLIGLRESIVIFLKGFLMGSADVVPGVSGGTMALITGIYERFIAALRSINFRFIGQFAKRDKKGAKESWAAIDLPFLIPLVIGILSAILIGARVVVYVLEHYPGPTYAFFFGLILASAGFVSKYVERLDAKHILLGMLGFVIVFYITGMDEITDNHSLPIIFIAGAIAVSAMILPGISGSLMLLIMGQYDYILNALNTWDMKVLTVFGAGAITGILIFARLLNYLLEHWKSITMVFLFGSMLGALRLPAERIHETLDYSSTISILAVVVVAAFGFFGVLLLERKSGDIEKRLGLEEDGS
jgi:putative membrane protein